MQYHHVRGLAGKWQNYYLYQVCTPLQSKRPVKRLRLLCLVMMWCLNLMHSCWQLLCSVLSVRGFSWIWWVLLLVVRLEDCSCLCRHLPRWRFWSAEAECFQGRNCWLGWVTSCQRNSWEPAAFMVPGQNTFLWWLQWDRSSEDRWRRLESVKSAWGGGGKGSRVIFGRCSKILHSRLSTTHCQSLDMLLSRCGAF